MRTMCVSAHLVHTMHTTCMTFLVCTICMTQTQYMIHSTQYIGAIVSVLCDNPCKKLYTLPLCTGYIL